MRLFLALGVTVRTAPRTLRAAMWMATPLPSCRHRESRLRRCCKKIMLIMRWKRQTGLFFLADNDAYHALEKVGGLIHTGPTGTNVNDIAVLLIDTAD